MLKIPDAKLVSYSQPVDFDTIQDLIVYIARVSNPDNQRNFLTGPKLLKYLLKKSHHSPFEHAYFTIELNTTRDIGRQLLRHGSYKFQEFSLRYAEASLDMDYRRECRFQDTKNRQNSIPTDLDDLGQALTAKWWDETQGEHLKDTEARYKTALTRGMSKEQARALLPEGLTPTTMYITGNLRTYLFFALVRCHPSTQKEHRELAKMIWEIVVEKIPIFQKIDVESASIRYYELIQTLWEEQLNDSN